MSQLVQTITLSDTPQCTVFEDIYDDSSSLVRTIWKAGTPQATRQANADALAAKAQQALTANQTFLALASPTNPQVLAQAQRLTRQVDALIHLALNSFDDVSDS